VTAVSSATCCKTLLYPNRPIFLLNPFLASAAPLRRSLPVSPEVGEVLSICTQLFDIFKFLSKIEIKGHYAFQWRQYEPKFLPDPGLSAEEKTKG